MRTLVGLFALAPAIWAQTYTQIAVFDPPGATWTLPHGINNAGQVVGDFRDAAGAGHGFLRSADGKTFTAIDYPGAMPGTTTATGINNLGQVVGSYSDAAGPHAYIRNADGSFTKFDIPGESTNGGPRAINDLGEVVGTIVDVMPLAGSYFRRSPDGALTNAGTPGIPWAINNAGTTVGTVLLGGSNGVFHGFLCTRDACQLWDPPGTESGNLSGINNLGQIAGSGFVTLPDGSVAVRSGLGGPINDSAVMATGKDIDGILHGVLYAPEAGPEGPTIHTAILPGFELASAFGGQNQSIGPGSWIEIYGQHLAPRTRTWSVADFVDTVAPTVLDGVSVHINGQAAFVSYISPGQVNALLPGNLAPGPAQLTVTNGAMTSAPVTLTIAPSGPGILMLPHRENKTHRYLAAVFPDFRTFVLPPGYTNAVPTRRAKVGELIVLYAIGFGRVTPDVPVGQIAPQAGALQAGVQVFFNGVPAVVQYAGTAPGTVGLYQFNVIVPDVAPSDQVLVTMRWNGLSLPISTGDPQFWWIPVER